MVTQLGHTSTETNSWRVIRNQLLFSLLPRDFSSLISLQVCFLLILCRPVASLWKLTFPQPQVHDTFPAPAPLTNWPVTYPPRSGRESSGPLGPDGHPLSYWLWSEWLGKQYTHGHGNWRRRQLSKKGSVHRANILTVSFYKRQSRIQ